MSEDTGSSTEATSVSNGSGLSMIHMRGGLFGKSAATLNDETTKNLSTSIVSEKSSSESTDNKLCNDEKRDETSNEKADESQSKLDDSVKIANEDNKSTESHSEEKENAKSDSVDDQQANTSSADNDNNTADLDESMSAKDNCVEAETNAEDSLLINAPEESHSENDTESQEDQSQSQDQQEEPDSTTPEQAEHEESSKADETQDSRDEDLSDHEEESPKAVVKSPGRRGRPPKCKEVKKAEVEVEEPSTPRTLRARNTEPVTPKVVKTPNVKSESTGKRGRPPKRIQVVSSPMSTNARRGRKKKEETEEVSEKSDEEEDEEQEADVSATTEIEAETEPEPDTETENEAETDADATETVDSDDEVEKPKKTRRGSSKQTVTPKTPPRSAGRPKRNAAASATAPKVESPAKAPSRRPSRRVSTLPESTATPKKKVEVKVPASAPPARKASKLNQKDPYDFSPEQETPPVFFKNIEMKLQSFGDVTYSRVGTGKYENTEKAAEARVSNLVDLVPAQKSKKTLAELTPRSAKGKKEEKTTPAAKAESESPKQAKTPKATPGRKRKQGDSLVTSSPKKAAVLTPVLDDREQWVVDHPDDEHLPYEAGARVYAVFNKVLYPAIVLNSGKDSLGRYKVQYVSDKVVKDVPNEGIIPLRAVVADKQCVAQVGSDWMEMQIVQAPKVDDVDEWKKAVFTLTPVDEEDKAEVTTDKYSWTSINLDSSDWRDYIAKKSREVTEVLVDNISAGDNRTSRRSRGAEKVNSYTPAKPVTGKKSKVREEEVMEVDDAYDDPPREKFEPIFSGKIFILTSAQRGSDATGFKKKLMSEFIEQCHGVVVEDFMAVEDQRELEPFLISDTCYRTHKYLSALARGIPCVSHEWIEKCREAKTLVDYASYLLPAGKSILDDQMYPLPKNQRTLLKDKVVLVHSTNRPATPRSLNFYQIWQPMVSWLGGTPLNEIPENIGIIDFILADNSASPELIELAVEKGISIASSEWVIQAIIMDKLPSLDSHPRFRYDVSASNHS
ncbi:unnamed protein product [Auanema sp. JU1783]|nr:unnamed protein product [Auanema sp. JU1783]